MVVQLERGARLALSLQSCSAVREVHDSGLISSHLVASRGRQRQAGQPSQFRRGRKTNLQTPNNSLLTIPPRGHTEEHDPTSLIYPLSQVQPSHLIEGTTQPFHKPRLPSVHLLLPALSPRGSALGLLRTPASPRWSLGRGQRAETDVLP